MTITIYAHRLINILDSSNNDVKRSISLLFDKAVTDTKSQKGIATYSVRKDDFYVVAGNFGPNTFYERLTISSDCPAIFNSLGIFYPRARERSLDSKAIRMSLSLRATCSGEEGAAKFN